MSYALNGPKGRISEQTCERVLEAAQRLGYVANAMASALRTGRTEIVLLALPPWPLGSPVADWVSAGITEFERLGYTPLVHLRHSNDDEALMQACARAQPVGLVGPAEVLTPGRVAWLTENGTRAILAIGQKPLSHVPTVVFDQALVGETAIAHLIERGHRDIVSLLPREPQFTAIGTDRLQGAQDIATTHGATLHVVKATCSMADIGRALAPVLPASPTAFHAFNDDYAFEAMEALRAAGRRVPADVAVIGCDDTAAARRAGMTTIALGDPRRWESVVHRIHSMVEGTLDRTPIVGLPRLVPRATT